MSIIFPSDTVHQVGASVPTNAIDASEFSRVGPLITPEDLVNTHLFGIPLWSGTPDPVTKKRAQLTPDLIKQQILLAVSRIELESGICIFPVAKQVRMPFDRHHYNAFGYIQFPDRPILSIQSLDIITPTGNSVYRVPGEWISPGDFHIGQVSLVPIVGAFQGAGFLSSATGRGAAFITVLSAQGWIPSFWQGSYVTGFDDGKIPRVVNDIIGIDAAIGILSLLQTTDFITSTSIGIDGLSQGVSHPGAQKYQPRIEQLKEQKAILIKKLRSLFNLEFLTNSL